MPAIITNKFRIHNSEQFRESFSEAAPNVYYLGIGRAQTWTTLLRGDGRTDYEGSDTLPILPSDTVATEFNTFDDRSSNVLNSVATVSDGKIGNVSEPS